MLVGGVCSCVGDVFQDNCGVQLEPLGYLDDPLGSERAFGVDVHGLGRAAALALRELDRHAESMADLSLSSSELAKDLGDGPCFDPAAQEFVELRGACGEEHHGLALLEELTRRDESHWHEFLT